MMLYPSVQQMTSENLNRYALVIATAKCARFITQKAVQKREADEAKRESGLNSKELRFEISGDSVNEKAVTVAITKIHSGEYKILL